MAYAVDTDLAAYMQQDVDVATANLVLQMVSDAMDDHLGWDPALYGVGTVTSSGNSFSGALLSQTMTNLLIDGPPEGSTELVLPGPYPVTAIASVQTMDVLGRWTTLVTQDPVLGTDYLWSSVTGIMTRIRNTTTGMSQGQISDSDFRYPAISAVGPPIWPRIPQGIKATYARGLTTVPGSVRMVNVAAAARAYANPLGVISQEVGGVSVRFSPRLNTSAGGASAIGGIDFNDAEQAALGRYRNVVAG